MKKKVKNRRKYDRSVYQSLALISQFGISMIVPIFMCAGAGYYLDRLLGKHIFFILLFFLGAAAGFRNIYIMAKRIGSSDEKNSPKKDHERDHEKDQ